MFTESKFIHLFLSRAAASLTERRRLSLQVLSTTKKKPKIETHSINSKLHVRLIMYLCERRDTIKNGSLNEPINEMKKKQRRKKIFKRNTKGDHRFEGVISRMFCQKTNK